MRRLAQRLIKRMNNIPKWSTNGKERAGKGEKRRRRKTILEHSRIEKKKEITESYDNNGIEWNRERMSGTQKRKRNSSQRLWFHIGDVTSEIQMWMVHTHTCTYEWVHLRCGVGTWTMCTILLYIYSAKCRLAKRRFIFAEYLNSLVRTNNHLWCFRFFFFVFHPSHPPYRSSSFLASIEQSRLIPIYDSMKGEIEMFDFSAFLRSSHRLALQIALRIAVQ